MCVTDLHALTFKSVKWLSAAVPIEEVRVHNLLIEIRNTI